MTRRPSGAGPVATGPVADRVSAVRDGPVNLFVVEAPGGLLCVDAGWNARRVAGALGALGLQPADVVAVLLTHTHWDHALAVGVFPRAQVFAGAGEAMPPLLRWGAGRRGRPWVLVRDGEALAAGGLRVTVTATPGHTPGSVCYVIDGRLLFTGDTVRLRHGVALPRRSWTARGRAAAVGSLRRLARLEGVELLLTAHTGVSDDPAGALRRWRPSLAGGTAGGDGPR